MNDYQPQVPRNLSSLINYIALHKAQFGFAPTAVALPEDVYRDVVGDVNAHNAIERPERGARRVMGVPFFVLEEIV